MSAGACEFRDIDGAKVELQWGAVDGRGDPILLGAQEQQVSFKSALRPGAWSDLTVALQRVPPPQVRVRPREAFYSHGIRLLR